MPSYTRPISIVEIDIDTCTRTWGVSPCMAAFGVGVVRKCYNTFDTCAYKQAYNKGVMTLKFIEEGYSVRDGNYFPALKSVGGYEQEVNIAGYSTGVGSIGALGKRARIKVNFEDFPYRDTLTDKYWDGRMDGTAQTNEGGYDPLERGSFWTKFKARNPNYAGRPMRVIQAHIDAAGDLVYDTIRTYVLEDFSGPDAKGGVTITAMDILSLADDKKAQAPITSGGRLLLDVTIDQGAFTLSPSGVGDDQYPASGFITIGSEIMRFTRIGDVMTVVRGMKGTQAATHTTNDTVQTAFDVENVRADEVIRSLLVDYAKIPSSYINFPEWQEEFNRWGNRLNLTATICKPTGVTELLGEICVGMISIWWDEVAQLIRIKLNHPPDEPPVEWSDRNNILEGGISTKDHDDERATRIAIWTVQIDPTKGMAKDNFLRGYMPISVDSESPEMFDSSRTHSIYYRWFNLGADSAIKILSNRLLNRYRRAPQTYTVEVDIKDDPALTDVVRLNSYVATDVTGLPTERLAQVYSRTETVRGSRVKVQLQMFQFDQRYGKIAPNDYPVYSSATDEQKDHGSFFVGPTLKFADGRDAYQFT